MVKTVAVSRVSTHCGPKPRSIYVMSFSSSSSGDPTDMSRLRPTRATTCKSNGASQRTERNLRIPKSLIDRRHNMLDFARAW